jgi:DNA-binding NarL/FixJ family response regulator
MTGSEIVGREAELARLTRLLESLADGGGALVLSGQPGVGKSALLHWAGRYATSQGMWVLSATGVQDEFEIPYAGLHLLAAGLPRDRRAGLAEQIAGEQPPARVAQTLLELVSELGRTRPVALCVDDAQWLDPQSWAVLAFAARRLADDPVLVLLAMRESGEAERRLAGSRIPRLPVEPLSAGAAVEVLDRHWPGLPGDRRDQVLTEAAGNPLGLIELASVVPVRAGVPLPLPERLERAFARAVADLPPATQVLVQVAALNDSNDTGEIVQAGRRLNPGVTAGDLRPAVTAKIFVVAGPGVEFRHPLIRSGVRQAIGAGRGREIHAALAAVLDGAGRRQLWHRVAAVAGVDEDLAGELSRLGDALHAHESAELAVRAYEAAARLTSDPRVRTDVLWRAFDALNDIGGQPPTRRLLDHLATQPLSAGDRAMVAYFTYLADGGSRGPAEQAAHLLDTVESFISDGLATTALESLRHFSLGVFWSNPDTATRQRAVATVARMPYPATEPVLCAALGLWAPLEQGAVVAEALSRYAAGPDDAPTLHTMSMAAMSIGALPLALRLLARAVVVYRRTGLLGVLGDDLALQAVTMAALGRAESAETAAVEGRALNTEVHQPHQALVAEMARGQALALRGDIATARAVADDIERILIPDGAYSMLAHVQLIRGTASLGEGRPERAYEELAPVFDPAALPYHRFIRFWALASLAEAAIGCGREEQLRTLVAELSPLSASHNAALHRGLSYARALLADTEPAYVAALADEDRLEWPFETARLQHAYGRWLRRRRRVSEARAQLRAAADTFTALGTKPWAARSDTELRATGERVDRDADTWQLLTPQEFQIAELVAEGKTSREIAARLFLSPRTVESHLHRTYRKVGVSSRAELAYLFVHRGSGGRAGSPA